MNSIQTYSATETGVTTGQPVIFDCDTSASTPYTSLTVLGEIKK